MSTAEKIKRLGALYKRMLTCRDEFAVCGGITPEDIETLLDFARKIAGSGDATMQRVINGLRGLLENEVHTASGL